MSLKENKRDTLRDQRKLSPTPSSKSTPIEEVLKINNEKICENLSDEENLSEFDSESEDEANNNGNGRLRYSSKCLKFVI